METEKALSPVVAGIVTFNPDIDRLRLNLDAVTAQVNKLIIIDNHSGNVNDIKQAIGDYHNVFLVPNEDNFGIAKALNQIMDHASKSGAQWVLTLDQDSVISSGLVQAYLEKTDIPSLGILTCLIKDRNAVGYEAKASDRDYEQVERCITSGSFIRVAAWEDVGGFDEKMFIDYVDYDLCMSLREKGYSIIRINYEGLLHELGHSKDIHFLGKNLVIHNHSSVRKYYIVRNRAYYIKKHAGILNVWAERRHLLGFIVLTVFKEPNKASNIKAMLKGLIDSGKM